MATLATELVPLYEELADPELLETWTKAVFRRPERGRLAASPAALKRGPSVKLVETVGRREETRNVPLADWPVELRTLLDEELLGIDVVGANGDWHARRTKKGRWLVTRGKPSQPARRGGLAAHDRSPTYPLPPGDPGGGPAVRRDRREPATSSARCSTTSSSCGRCRSGRAPGRCASSTPAAARPT